MASIFHRRIFREAWKTKRSKILAARSIRWRQPRPNEPARRAVRYWRTTVHTVPFAPCAELSKPKDGKPLELGHGGVGVTYKAIDTRLGCPVVLKIINLAAKE